MEAGRWYQLRAWDVVPTILVAVAVVVAVMVVMVAVAAIVMVVVAAGSLRAMITRTTVVGRERSRKKGRLGGGGGFRPFGDDRTVTESYFPTRALPGGSSSSDRSRADRPKSTLFQERTMFKPRDQRQKIACTVSIVTQTLAGRTERRGGEVRWTA